MVLYYSAERAVFSSIFSCSAQGAFVITASSVEFWVVLVLHVGLIYGLRAGSDALSDLEDYNFDWGSLGAGQFFSIFFVSFYNTHTHRRFLRLYNQSMCILDHALLFAQELVVSLPAPGLENHRSVAMKYMLAGVHLFFFTIAGGPAGPHRHHWRLLIQKGMLTQDEVLMLHDSPFSHIGAMAVLNTWALKVVDMGLRDSTLWVPRSQRIGHVHNRMDKHILSIMQAAEDIVETISMPLPYHYYHMMNITVLVNCVAFAVAAAIAFRTYLTIVPMVLMLAFQLSLREVAGASTSPFGPEADANFPIEKFLQSVFDSSVCLLESFHNVAAWRVSTSVESATTFLGHQIKHRIPVGMLYRPHYDEMSSSQCHWTRETPASALHCTTATPVESLRHGIRTPEPDAHQVPVAVLGADPNSVNPLRKHSLSVVETTLISIPEEAVFTTESYEKALREKLERRAELKQSLCADIDKVRADNQALEDEALKLRTRIAYTEKRLADMEAQGGKLPVQSVSLRRSFVPNPEEEIGGRRGSIGSIKLLPKKPSQESSDKGPFANMAEALSKVQVLQSETSDGFLPSTLQRSSGPSGGVWPHGDESEGTTFGSEEQGAAGFDAIGTARSIPTVSFLPDFLLPEQSGAPRPMQTLQTLMETEVKPKKKAAAASKTGRSKSPEGAKKKGTRPSPSKSPSKLPSRHKLDPYLPPEDDTPFSARRSGKIPAGKERKAAAVPTSGGLALPATRHLVSPTASTMAPSEGGDTVVTLREVEGELHQPGDYWLL